MDQKPADLRSQCEGGTQQFYQVEDGWMETYSGQQFFFLNPRQDSILIEDVAHALSNLCRYGGHSRRFYSVAEHCLLLSGHVELMRPDDVQTQLDALMHDATEGYLVDMPRPIKHVLKDYKRIEDGLAVAIAQRFGLSSPMDRLIHEADSRILRDERMQVMSDSGNNWGTDSLQALGVTIEFLSPWEAERRFLKRFGQLNERLRRG